MDNQKEARVSMEALSGVIEEVITSGRTVELTVRGNSMFPMLRHDVSVVRLAKSEKLRRGDIPLYKRSNGAYVLHRIVAVGDETFDCCGDNQWRIEKGIGKESVIAVVTDFKRTKKWHSCESLAYRTYVCVWIALRPIRHIFSAVKGRVRRIFK